MIAEIIPEAYDARGRQVSQPFLKRKSPHPTFPMGRYVSQPLTTKCTTLNDVRRFLAKCEYVSDKELFDKDDYWQPPEEFEKRKKGDCEDFALWTWRQLLEMGYDARFIGGACGHYGEGHAWVEYFDDGRWYLVETLASRVGFTLPRLFTLEYEPRYSVSWDGKTLRYFSHKKPHVPINWWALSPLILEYLPFWGWLNIMKLFRLPGRALNTLRKNVLRRELWFQKRKR